MVRTTEPRPIGRRERERLTRRQEILKAAREVFLARGYERATLDEISRRAEFAKGTIYRYFPSKGKLFEALVDDEFGRVITEVRGVKERSVTDAARRIAGVVLQYITIHNDFFRLAMAHEERARREGITHIRLVIFRRMGELAAAAGEQIMAAGREVLTVTDEKLVGFILLGLVHYFSIYYIKYGSGFPANAAEVIAGVFTSGLTRLKERSKGTL